MEKNSLKKSLAIILTALMIFALCPIAVFANDVIEDDDDGIIPAAEINYSEYYALLDEYNDLFGKYKDEAAKFNGLMDTFEGLEKAYEDAWEAYQTLADAYELEDSDVSYDEVKTAFDAAATAYDTLESFYMDNDLEALQDEINALVGLLEVLATEIKAAFGDAVGEYHELITQFKNEMKEFRSDYEAFLQAEAKKLAAHEKAVQDYEEELLKWQADKEAYEEYQKELANMTGEGWYVVGPYTGSSKLTWYGPSNQDGDGGNIDIRTNALLKEIGVSIPKNSDYTAHHINFVADKDAQDGYLDVIIEDQNNNNTKIVVRVFITKGKTVSVVQPFPYSQGGIHRVALGEFTPAASDPGEEPIKPEDYTPGDFDGLRPDRPNKPQKTKLPNGTEVWVTLNEIGQIIAIKEVDPDPDPDTEHECDLSYRIVKLVSLDGEEYSEMVEAADGAKVYFKVTITAVCTVEGCEMEDGDETVVVWNDVYAPQGGGEMTLTLADGLYSGEATYEWTVDADEADEDGIVANIAEIAGMELQAEARVKIKTTTTVIEGDADADADGDADGDGDTPQRDTQPIVPFTPVTAEIPDATPPLAGLMEVTLPEEEEFVIMDEDIPLGNLPQTGSTANAAMGAAGLMAALFSLAGAGATLAKKEED